MPVNNRAAAGGINAAANAAGPAATRRHAIRCVHLSRRQQPALFQPLNQHRGNAG